MSKLILLILASLNAQSCPNKDLRCASCLGSNCHFCYDGFLGSNNVCQPSTVKIDNCLSYSADQECKQCVFGYALTNNKCDKIVKDNCLRVDSNKNCIACANGIKVLGGDCKAENKCTIPNCDICGVDNQVEICVMCKTGFSIYPKDTNDFCSSVIPGCLALNFYDNTQCAMCHANYYFKDGQCEKSSAYSINQKGESVLRVALLSFLLFWS